MKITIETIPHSEQRYPTVGDWQKTPDGLQIKVSQMSDERYAILVAIHELIEFVLCEQHGISGERVDAFDMAFEKEREEYAKAGVFLVGEPGDNLACPYRNEHAIATGIERIMAAQLEVNWKTYEKEVNSL